MCVVEQQTNLDCVRVRPVTLGDVTCYQRSNLLIDRSTTSPATVHFGTYMAYTRRGKGRRDCVKPSKRGQTN